MAERHTYGDPENRDETYAPQNPPNSVEPVDMKDIPQSAAGVAGMWYVLGPLILIAVVIGIALFFWASEPDIDRDEAPAIGTVGQEAPGSETGGGNPGPDHDNTADEREFKGGDPKN
jgi:hypothetical protein